MSSPPPDADGMRLDKWLWAARFYKTRGLAVEAIDRGRVAVNGQPAKRSRELHVGDRVALRQGERGEIQREVQVLGLSPVRGPAPVAQLLYAETAQSLAAREAAAQARALQPEPAHAIEQGRPTKRDRRRLADWQRWSASADDLER
jgi:ribosome-associated heat shock protein Hsp15